jgi:hypothetical protein
LAYATRDSAIEGRTIAASYLSCVTARRCAQAWSTEHHILRGAPAALSNPVQSLNDSAAVVGATLRARHMSADIELS